MDNLEIDYKKHVVLMTRHQKIAKPFDEYFWMTQ